jgi:ABC-type multidrug transport system ATPase subunit
MTKRKKRPQPVPRSETTPAPADDVVAPVDDAPAIETVGLTKAYGELVALAPLTVRIEHGERVVVVGTNGSGKTTLIRMLAGLLEPTDGSAAVSGDPAGSIDARAALSYIPDDPVVYEDLSLAEHVEYVARLHDTEGWEGRGAYLLERLGIAHRADDLPMRFSRGLRQKTSLALGLVRPFEVLLVDEPFVGLDQTGKEALVELLDEAAKEGATLVVATHQLEFVGQATRCIALRDGDLLYDGPADIAKITELLS